MDNPVFSKQGATYSYSEFLEKLCLPDTELTKIMYTMYIQGKEESLQNGNDN